MLRYGLLLCASLVVQVLFARDFYISSINGNDANNGTSAATAWRTVARLNQSTYSVAPGDRVLFERGGVYRGEVIGGVAGTAAQPIVYAAYGTGAAPQIKGSQQVTGWVRHSGNIWKAQVTARVTQLYVDGQRMTPARYPNTGWLRNAQASGNTLRSNDLTQADGYWVGARAVIRRTSSSIDTMVVTGFSNRTLTFSQSAISALGNEDWGFFLTKRLGSLDIPGEWHYDTDTRTVYLWAPGGADPNGLLVEGSVFNEGIYVYWRRAHIHIRDLHFMHQRIAGVRVDDGISILVENCTMEYNFHGIRSVGDQCTYRGNTIRKTYDVGALLIDKNTLFENNTLTDIALIPGEGGHAWGYQGVRVIGQNNTVRHNDLDNIGYTGIEVSGRAVIERNIIHRSNATLNDGAGIAFDHVDELLVKDNIITDPIGNMDGSSTLPLHSKPMSNGIYFGNTRIANATVQGNTVSGCGGTGINVDHTHVAQNYRVIDNVLFNNAIQMTLSDYSNYNGPGAVEPYFVPNFNGVYEGNIMYCLSKEQWAMKQFHCYNPTQYVDFGSYANNRFYNAYQQTSIFIHNLRSRPYYYSMEKWQQDYNEGQAGTVHPLRDNPQGTVREISGNMVLNGTFDEHVEGWGGWPTNATATHVTDHLDNGALRAHLPNSSVYPTYALRNPDWMQVRAGEWYRLRMSLHSNAEGHLLAGLKGESQLNNPFTVYERQLPFGPERRDIELYFQSGMTDRVRVQLVNNWTEPLYYLDNVEFHHVEVEQLDPHDHHVMLTNVSDAERSMALPPGEWMDTEGVRAVGTAVVRSYGSRVFFKLSPDEDQPNNTVRVKLFLGGALEPGEELMSDGARSSGVLPQQEPYTSLGHTVANASMLMGTAQRDGQDGQAVVDWVMLELRDGSEPQRIIAAKAALLLRNGSVIAANGGDVAFPTSVEGKYLVVRHRNHLGVMTAAPLRGADNQVDLTDPAFLCYGTEARMVQGGRAMLWPGDVNGDGVVSYVGANNDRDALLQLLNAEPNGNIRSYSRRDVNVDGWVRYIGQNNDRDPILNAIGGQVPTQVRRAQLP